MRECEHECRRVGARMCECVCVRQVSALCVHLCVCACMCAHVCVCVCVAVAMAGPTLHIPLTQRSLCGPMSPRPAPPPRSIPSAVQHVADPVPPQRTASLAF